MKYAVVRIGGKQYKVAEKQEVVVDKLNTKTPELDTLLVVDDKTLKIGKPTVSDAKISVKVLNADYKGKKITVSKYKAKSRYRRVLGFRPRHTKLLIEKIA